MAFQLSNSIQQVNPFEQTQNGENAFSEPVDTDGDCRLPVPIPESSSLFSGCFPARISKQFLQTRPNTNVFESDIEQARIDLKMGQLTHQNVGQLQMCVNCYPGNG